MTGFLSFRRNVLMCSHVHRPPSVHMGAHQYVVTVSVNYWNNNEKWQSARQSPILPCAYHLHRAASRRRPGVSDSTWPHCGACPRPGPGSRLRSRLSPAPCPPQPYGTRLAPEVKGRGRRASETQHRLHRENRGQMLKGGVVVRGAGSAWAPPFSDGLGWARWARMGVGADGSGFERGGRAPGPPAIGAR
jgi:hypothetical protein